jgi:hypothetical protein
VSKGENKAVSESGVGCHRENWTVPLWRREQTEAPACQKIECVCIARPGRAI